MPRSILKINISNELDVVLAYKRAMQLSERLNISMGSQTKFSTAVSEICRNVVEHVGNGQIQFSVVEENGVRFLEAIVSDRGRGIGNIDYLLNRQLQNSSHRGTGIVNSRKLVDFFHIVSEFEKGTKVTLRQRLPHNAPALTKAVTEAWTHELDQEVVSPYAEIKKQNMQLLDVLDDLRKQNDVAQQQLQEISRLNVKLQQSNDNIQELLDERERQNKLLQNINNNLDAFAHTVSHDLRAPLQNIAGLSNALEDCLFTDKLTEAKELFPMLHEQTQRMDNFITSMLSYSLAGLNNIPKVRTDVTELVQDVMRLLGVHNSIVVNLAANLPVLYTEKVFLHQVFSNLISNAIKYHDLKEEPTLEVSYEKQEAWLLFSVQDNGPGIPKEDTSRIFEMYETLGNGEIRRDSIGLGLPIVRKIISEKGGRIWVESGNRGATFYFTWPAAELAE